MFAYKSGIKLVSAIADVDVQALENSVHILSKISITETAENITLTAKGQLTINGGGSFSVFKDGNITHGTAGVWDVNAATKDMTGPQSLPVQATQLKQAFPFDEQFRAMRSNGAAVPFMPYAVYDADGKVVAGGVTDAGGYTDRIYSKGAKTLSIHWGVAPSALAQQAPIHSLDDESC
jgi:type VI secretion system secreted protein VgrG